MVSIGKTKKKPGGYNGFLDHVLYHGRNFLDLQADEVQMEFLSCKVLCKILWYTFPIRCED